MKFPKLDALVVPTTTTPSSSSKISDVQFASPAALHSKSPYALSPWSPALASPFAKSPWTQLPLTPTDTSPSSSSLLCSLVREEGHVYSLAASGDLLFTGSESKNIRVWKNSREFAGFKSGSGLVKAIVIAGDKIFTGHQDGKIRVWSESPSKNSANSYKRVGTLPSLRDVVRTSLNPSSYVEVRRHKNAVWLRHYDAVSCLSYDEFAGVLYSGSWDRTVKVWRVSDSRCLESIPAHDDAVNAVASAGFDRGLVFTGSADGTVKAWRREPLAAARHVLVQKVLEHDGAVTALSVAPAAAGVLYGGCSDGSVRWWRWEKARGRMVNGGALRAHRMAVLCLAAVGAVAASGSADKTVCVWRRDPSGGAHTRVAVLRGHAGPVKCLALEREEKVNGRVNGRVERGGGCYVLYSGSLDRSVKIWHVSESDVAGEEEGTVSPAATSSVNGLRRTQGQVRSSERFPGGCGRREGGGVLVQDVRV